MTNKERFARDKLDTYTDICHAFKEDLKRRQREEQLQPATVKIIEALRGAVGIIQKNIEKKEKQSIWEEDKININTVESDLYSIGIKILVLVKILKHTENSRLGDVPFSIASPLRKEVKRIYDNADILIVSSSQLNYTIKEISSKIKNDIEVIKNEAPDGYSDNISIDRFPEKIFKVTFPSISYKRALLTPIFAHEICHPLISSLGLNEVIPNQEDIFSHVRDVNQDQEAENGSSLDDTDLRNEASRKWQITADWIGEISSDMLAVKIYGPAYALAVIDFLPAIDMLDVTRGTHPPPRLRLRALLSQLDESFDIGRICSNKTEELLRAWMEISVENIQFDDEEENIDASVIHSILRAELPIDTLVDKVSEKTPSDLLYGNSQYKLDIEQIAPLISQQIPPTVRGITRDIGLVNILNGAWEAYIGRMDEFRSNMSNGEKDTKNISERFNKFVLKCIELNDVKDTWNNAVSHVK